MRFLTTVECAASEAQPLPTTSHFSGALLMAYSCSDFADDVLNDLAAKGWLESALVAPDDPQAQADAVLTAIADANGTLQLAANAKQFHAELLDGVETLTGISEEHGAGALAHVVYLQMAILKGTSIELSSQEARSLAFIRRLPSGERWWKHVAEVE